MASAGDSVPRSRPCGPEPYTLNVPEPAAVCSGAPDCAVPEDRRAAAPLPAPDRSRDQMPRCFFWAAPRPPHISSNTLRISKDRYYTPNAVACQKGTAASGGLRRSGYPARGGSPIFSANRGAGQGTGTAASAGATVPGNPSGATPRRHCRDPTAVPPRHFPARGLPGPQPPGRGFRLCRHGREVEAIGIRRPRVGDSVQRGAELRRPAASHLAPAPLRHRNPPLSAGPIWNTC